MKKIALSLLLLGSLVISGCNSPSEEETTSTSSSVFESSLSSAESDNLSTFKTDYEELLNAIDKHEEVDTNTIVETYEEINNPDEGTENVTFEEFLTNPDSTFSAVSLAAAEDQSEENKKAFIDTFEGYLDKKINSYDIGNTNVVPEFIEFVNSVDYPESFKTAVESMTRNR